MKTLFFDIETCYNIVKSFQIGEVRLNHNSIVEHSKIIMICYKWEGDKKVHSLVWDENPDKKAIIRGDDRKMIKEFAKVVKEADQLIAHNGDRFDLKWFRTQCLLYGVIIPPDIITIDTLKEARKYFRFPSNRLDYISKRLGYGGKDKITEESWDMITLYNDPKHLKKMVKYCKRDVLELENVYQDFKPYIKAKLTDTLNRPDCPKCGGKTIIEKYRRRATGTEMVQLQCKVCGSYHTIPVSKLEI